MIHGPNPEVDILTGQALVPPRMLRHLDVSRCSNLTDNAVQALAHNAPLLEGLSLSGCSRITDSSLAALLATVPQLTHLDLEELSELTNALLSEHLVRAPCASRLEHLGISFCENLGDSGVLPVVKTCTALQSVEMDNTRISDLVLAEAAHMVKTRSNRSISAEWQPRTTLKLVVFDCGNVTWTGVNEILSRNAEAKHQSRCGSDGREYRSITYPDEVIGLKCFYGWQMTVDEHHKRVMAADHVAANRLCRRWAEYMMASEEAGADGAGARRRRRRARQAAMLHADEEEAGVPGVGAGRRRRARSGGCEVM
jgi:F-box/leucine-rich repeat protein 2/20